MSPEEILFLGKVGQLIDNGVAWVITLTFLHGVFVLLFGMSTASIIRRGMKKLPQLAMFIVTLASFIVATLYLGAQMASLSITVRTFFIGNTELSFPAKLEIYRRKVFPTNLIIAWASEIVPIISDAVVIWRAWVIFTLDRRWLLIGPIALWVGTIASALGYLVLTSSFDGVQGLNTGGTQQNLFTANIALSFATNVAATLLIGYKLWALRATVSVFSQKTSMPVHVLIVLVESGVIYCVLQLVTLVMSIAPNGGTGGVPGSAEWVASQIFSSAYFEISAMYAAIVVVVVNARRSIVDTYGFSDVTLDVEGQVGRSLPGAGVRSGTLGRMSFITPLPQSVRSTSSGSGDSDPADVEKLSEDGMRGNGNSEGSSDKTITAE
ncbi:hypothetical protein Hypma_002326 [Hypsizygus marmoreus]|uniref:Uncharacterized protein n=1 Tax=Hypsizygus marmoreus TaxID=39966 RepID=A0A369K594_HYPMA|nr:hypothetical protein Hypma_002326 [Hypsizygus marmoreus]